MRDSFVADTSVSERDGDYWMEIAGVNDAADPTKKCLEYHVNADATCMHHGDMKGSYKEIVNVEATGTYYITTAAGHDIASFSRTAVNCQMAGVGSTWQLVTGSISYAHGTGVCPAGMAAFTGGKCDFPWVTEADRLQYEDRVCYDNAGATNGIMHSETAAPGSASTIVKDTAYLCVSASADQSRQVFNSALTSNTHSNHFNTITQAEVGKYIIRYSSEDHASNAMPCCYRTVVVRDTLPPVISLHRVSDGKILMKGDGVSSATNPAWGVANPNLASGDYLMAESAQTASVNGWIIGAVASGVTGLALVAYATKL